jgi:hypothetical protein
MKISELRHIIREMADNELAKKYNLEDGIPSDVTKEEEKINKEMPEDMIKDAEEYDKDEDPKLQAGDDNSSTKYKLDVIDANRGRGVERLKYDGINDKFQARVRALVMGKNSESQADIDDKASGVSTKSNEKFYNRAVELNKYDNNHSGVGGTSVAVAQLGDDIEILPNEKPAHQKNAFDGNAFNDKGEPKKTNESKNGKLLKEEMPTNQSKSDEKVEFEHNFARVNRPKANYKSNYLSNKELDSELPEREFDMRPWQRGGALSEHLGKEAYAIRHAKSKYEKFVYMEEFVKELMKYYKTGDEMKSAMDTVDFKYDDLGVDFDRMINYIEGKDERYNESKQNKGKKQLKEISGAGFLEPGDEGYISPGKANIMFVNDFVKELNQKGSATPDELQHLGKMLGETGIQPQYISQQIQKLLTFPINNPQNGQEPQQNPVQAESKLRKLAFNKTQFINENHMLSLIPEAYKINGNKFIMKDMRGNEFTINVNEGKCNIVNKENNLILENQLKRVKELFNYNSEEAMGIMTEKEKITESAKHKQLLDTMRKLK